MNLKGGVVQNNASTSYGGGICLNNSTLNVSGGRIENNTAGNGTGGGIHAYAKSVVNITGGTVKDNNATNGQISLNASSAMLVDGQIGDVKTLSGAYCFYTNGGVFENSATMTALPEPSKKAWKFAGWYENENCTGDKVTTLQAGKTYYADWTAKEEQNMFYKPESVTKHLGTEVFTNELTKTDVHGDLTYKSGDEKVATVDAATGEVIIVGAGTATITATAAETGDYKEASASYELTVTNHEFKNSWESDADNHWHSCAVEGCTVKSDEAAHDFEWIVDKNATAAEKGTKHEECTVCHFQKDPVEIPAKGTAGGDQNANGSGTNADASANGTKTGDAMPIGLLAVLMMAAAAGIAFCGRKLYKNR